MKVRRGCGPWDEGWVLDKDMAKSTYIDDGRTVRPMFNKERTELGEAMYQLKYDRELAKAPLLARTVAMEICPKLDEIGSGCARPVLSLDLDCGSCGPVARIENSMKLQIRVTGGMVSRSTNSVTPIQIEQ